MLRGEIMKDARKKMIAPIVVSCIVILYYVLYFGFLIAVLPGGWRWVLGLVPIVFSAVMIKVCLERIHEIRTGEEDDISQY